ncbi:hypothetical protein [Ferrimicrobium sp.]|uniref:hypothetical protein n=1 Tax=Ferrimicrobium sp. TaxID=2926050 RepID=UPI00263883F2|nr:hypothetical protein [Ferrimicrobium sp.]
MLTQRRLQVALGLIWLLDAGLQFQPYMFSRRFVANFLAMNAMFQPHVVANVILDATKFLLPHAAAWNTLFAVTQLVIGVGLLWRRTVRAALVASFAWVLGVWAIGEGLGGLLTPVMGSPLAGFPGAVLLYGLLGLVLWPTGRPERYTVADAGPLGARGAGTLWALLWFGAAVEQVGAGFGQLSPKAVMISVIVMNEANEPSWLVHLDQLAAGVTRSIGNPIAVFFALVEVLIGVLVLRGHQTKKALWVAIALSVVFWIVGQDFGGVLAGGATDLNAGPLYVLLALSVYPLSVDRAKDDLAPAANPGSPSLE